ncbi:MAG: 1-(5-phosphoribosyl)-5-[(5-phosphoribosylamino)methylideneamino]imidazole-4-carboxamide isomerase [Armatimonadota bacterium]|nr:1-(5-phosphoribosyl)-5-[(5-phosphoribosylamino)methylideneamino]imidazole-4-carboxamide isomerase [Armatimonadota bacterium]MDW8155348.1 1-(5-phosphoribosyl)-5-[(5-phosphoribosylamino)methylideneamino]imidazole-4-carboxamide isomerase [Armatimonadota bacterium]
MTVFPALDLMGGKVVRLAQGDFRRVTVYAQDPVEMAARWAQAGARWVHVVDLDGAREGQPKHLHVVSALKQCGLRVQVGGGLREQAAVEAALEAGADRVVVGTRAVLDPAWLDGLCARWEGRVVVALDVREGRVVVRGWSEATPLDVWEAARRILACGVRHLLVTDVAADGVLAGPNLSLYRHLGALRASVIASGGVRDAEDVRALRRVGVAGVVVGRALYEGRLRLEEALQAAEPDPGEEP